MDDAPLTIRLRGRARFLRNRQEVKSPELMDDAATAIETLTRENAELAAGACVHPKLLIGDERGHFDCGIERITRERDEARAEVEQEAALRVGAIERMKAAEAERDTIRTQLTATQARLVEAVELIQWGYDTLYEINPSNYDHDEVTTLNDKSVEVALGLKAFLAQQEGQSNG